jgi:hypothetical protein
MLGWIHRFPSTQSRSRKNQLELKHRRRNIYEYTITKSIITNEDSHRKHDQVGTFYHPGRRTNLEKQEENFHQAVSVYNPLLKRQQSGTMMFGINPSTYSE